MHPNELNITTRKIGRSYIDIGEINCCFFYNNKKRERLIGEKIVELSQVGKIYFGLVLQDRFLVIFKNRINAKDWNEALEQLECCTYRLRCIELNREHITWATESVIVYDLEKNKCISGCKYYSGINDFSEEYFYKE